MASRQLDWDFYYYPEEMKHTRQQELRQWWQAIIDSTSPVVLFDVELEIATLYRGDVTLFLPQGVQGTLTYRGGEVDPHIVIVPTGAWTKHHWTGTFSKSDLAILDRTYRNEGERWVEIQVDQRQWLCACTVAGRLLDEHRTRFPAKKDILHTLHYTLTPHTPSEGGAILATREEDDLPSVRVLRRVAEWERSLKREPLFSLLTQGGDAVKHQSMVVRVEDGKPPLEKYQLWTSGGFVQVKALSDRKMFQWEASGRPVETFTQQEFIFHLSYYQPALGGLWDRLGSAIGLDDWICVERRATDSGSGAPAIRMEETALRYQDWLGASYHASSALREIEQRLSRPLSRTEIVFYAYLRGQDLVLDPPERSCYCWLGDLVAREFHREPDWFSRVLAQYISASPPESRQHQAYIELCSAIERATTQV